MDTKIIAMYLPQFHRVKENDEWWGEGFTEWTAVKNAKPLFQGHIQPRNPLNGFYYDLLDKKTMEWQSSLMHRYGIDGMCFYHYWFGDGKMILEKPAENLLEWKDIDMPFFFSWANDSWSRSWSNIKGNTWSDIFENEKSKPEKGVLLKQTYEREDEWTAHFEYLLPFFKDNRYMKIDEKPVFSFFYTENIPCLYAMTEHWRKLAKHHGFKGIYLMGFNTEFLREGLDALVMNSPHMFWQSQKSPNRDGIAFPSFRKTWERTLNAVTREGDKVYFGGVGNYDDTPRRGNVWGIVYEDYSVHDLEYYFKELLLKSYVLGNEYCFFNAWNEWGEGMYLEPDEEEGYARLEAIKNAKKEAERVIRLHGKEYHEKYSKMIVSQKEYWNEEGFNYRRASKHAALLDRLLRSTEDEIDITGILHKNAVNTAAIYGMGDVGYHLSMELKRKGIHISYVIDRNKKRLRLPFDIYAPGEEIPETDAIIITATMDYPMIYRELKKKTSAKIFSIEELFVDLL